MSYTINPNAKNKWARNAENTMDLSLETDASSVYLDNGRTLEQELGEGSMISNVATVDTSMSKGIDGTLDGVYESGVMYGRSLVNLFDKTKIQPHSGYSIGEDNTITYLSYQGFGKGVKLNCLKPNTKYALFFNVLSTSLDPDVPYRINDDGTNYGINIFGNKQDAPSSGYHSFVTGDNVDNVQFRFYTNERNEGYKLTLPVILEYQEGMENWDVSFFEGLCDVKMPILRNTGKNLFDMSMVETNSRTRSQWDTVISENSIRSTRCGDTTNGEFGAFIRIDNVKPSTTYTLTYKPYINNVYSNVHAYIYNNSTIWGEQLTAGDNGTIKFTTKSNTEYITIGLNYGICPLNTVYEARNIQFEESPTSTTYEDYKTNILRTPETVTLRSLPNGVRDELNLKTGEYIKRIGEIVLDGSETNWIVSGNTVNLSGQNTISFQRAFAGIKYGNNTANSVIINSDKLCGMKVASSTSDLQRDTEYIRPYSSTSENVGIRLLKSKLQTQDVDGLKQYLSQNPITVQYELAEPIVSTIEPLTIPFAYENGHVILESGYDGQSLLPTLEYSTVVNRTGQVESVAKVIQKQEKQLTMLEKMLIQNIISLDYNNTLLTLKNEMEEML